VFWFLVLKVFFVKETTCDEAVLDIDMSLDQGSEMT